MTDRALVDAVLRAADPIPNPTEPPSAAWTADTALLTIERRRAAFSVRQAPTHLGRAHLPSRRKGGQVAAAALLATLLIVGTVALLTRSDPQTPPVATTVPPTPTAPPVATSTPVAPTTTLADFAAESAARDVIDSAYALWNDGDAKGWVEVRDRGSAYVEPAERQNALADGIDLHLRRFAADARIEVTQCTSHGYGEWPDIADDGPATGYWFTCIAETTDAFREPAGIYVRHQFEWVVAEGAVVAVRSDDLPQTPPDRDALFMIHFREWFYANHRDLWAEINWPTEFPDLEAIPILLEYLDDYLATLE